VGSDFVTGGQGFDRLYGEDGNDTVVTGDVELGLLAPGFAAPYGDYAYGGAGDDLVMANYTNLALGLGASLEGGDGVDTVVGGDSKDGLYGGIGNDLLYARGGADDLFGGDGNDNIVSGQGSDLLYGGSGIDYFNLYFDLSPGDTDYLLDLAIGTDYIILPKWTQNDLYFFTSSGYAFGYLAGSGSSYYLFGAPAITIAQLQSAIYYY
jgi:Ca2+-binding RTX toxin-like protein